MKLNKQNLLNEAKQLTDFIIENCIGKSGLMSEYIDLTKRKVFGKALVSDLGDYVPFIFWLGKILDEKKYTQWSENQIKLALEFCQMPCGLFHTKFDSNKNKPPIKHNVRIFSISDQDDAIVGINLMYELTNRQLYKRLLISFFDGLFRDFTTKSGFIYSHGIPSFKFYIPISYSSYCGIFIEELSRLYKFTGKKKFVYLARRLSEAWINDEFFNKYGLFPFKFFGRVSFPFKFIFKLRTPFSPSIVSITKPNTNLLFGLLYLYEVDKNKRLILSIEKWIKSIRNNLLSEGGIFYSIWDTEKGGSNCTLEANHAILDVLLEAFRILKNEEILKLAKSCADSWIKHQSKTGLIPHSIENQFSRLDPQTDFAVVLLKLSEITGKKKYHTSAVKTLNGILKYHKLDVGYVDYVNIETKEKRDFIIQTKFLSLLLKLFLLTYEISKKKIYENDLLKSLIRDR